MAFKYFPHTEQDINDMLARVGAKSLDDLYADVPEEIRFKGDYDLPEAMSEIEIRKFFDGLCRNDKQLTCFAGAGVYDHYTPSIIPYIVERSEFLTSYTPYQAEISQGTLHYIFEYQTMMARLTGMDISNASMYDGTTATAEAVMMAAAATKKADTVLVSETVDPKTVEVIKTYAHFQGIGIEIIKQDNGATDNNGIKDRLGKGGVAGVVVQQPNRYGIIEDYDGLADACHGNKALFIINSVAADLALLKTPGEWGADIAIGDGQSLGLPISFGGPYVGYLCCTEKLMRKMPGRIVGQTSDNRGNRAFVLTLQAREQHIRRQKATSNICSNESLCALSALVYLTAVGKQGFVDIGNLCMSKAVFARNELLALKGVEPVGNGVFFNEFVIKVPCDASELAGKLIDKGFAAGFPLGRYYADRRDQLLIAVTEKRTKEEIKALANAMEALL